MGDMSKNIVKNNVRKMVTTALLMAVGVVLPVSLHMVPSAGSVLLPMHIPVLLCGLLCGPLWGLACGLLTPVLSCLFTGMPPLAYLPGMVCELAVYGLAGGLLMRYVNTHSRVADIYISLLGAMLAGRVVFGVLNAVIFVAGAYSLQVWVVAAFVTALPGIVIQLVLLPAIVLALQKAKLADTKEG